MLGGVVAVVLLVPSLLTPTPHAVSWKLDYGFGGPGFDVKTAQTTMIVPIEVTHPGCTGSSDESWLASPVIAYTPWSVTITMHMTDASIESTKQCVAQEPRNSSGLPLVGDYLSGVYYQVHLSEPLGGRALFDGVVFPPQARPYP